LIKYERYDVEQFVGRVEQSETRHNDLNHAVERAAEKRAPHGGVRVYERSTF